MMQHFLSLIPNIPQYLILFLLNIFMCPELWDNLIHDPFWLFAQQFYYLLCLYVKVSIAFFSVLLKRSVSVFHK